MVMAVPTPIAAVGAMADSPAMPPASPIAIQSETASSSTISGTEMRDRISSPR